jgi:uncharacterized protein with HEPN domain
VLAASRRRFEERLNPTSRTNTYGHFHSWRLLIDTKTIDALIRNLTVLGEAAKRVPEAVRALAPDVPWRAISGMRDVLIHDYFGVDEPLADHGESHGREQRSHAGRTLTGAEAWGIGEGEVRPSARVTHDRPGAAVMAASMNEAQDVLRAPPNEEVPLICVTTLVDEDRISRVSLVRQRRHAAQVHPAATGP